jgi:hypothetical protein
VDPRDPVDVLAEVAFDLGRVPEVPEIDHDPDVGQSGFVEQLERLRDRRDERELVALRGVDGLEPEPNARVVRRRGEPAQAVDDHAARLRLVAAAGGAGEAEDAARVEAGEAMQRGAHRVDALLDVLRAVDDGVRQDRGHERDAVGRAQAAPAQHFEIAVVVAELHLPDPDPVEAGRPVGADVLRERRADGRDLAERDRHATVRSRRPSSRRGSERLVSCFATR